MILKAGISKNFLTYLFSIDSVDWSKKRVKGLTYVPKLNKWANIWLPLPNVVYDRRARLTKEQRQKATQIRRKFKKELDIKYINRINYFGKWKPFLKLKGYDSMANYLPRTIRYRNFNDVTKMLKTYSFVFLKSFYGSQGKQVISIEKLTSNKYKLRYFKNGMNEVEVNDLKQVKTQIESFIGNKKIIVQQGLRLLKYKDRPFDLRVLVCKDNKGLWNVVKNYARIAKEQKQMYYSLGGKRMFYDKIYLQLYSSKGDIVPDSDYIENVAIKIVSCLDKDIGPFGELGLDFAIDINGKLWLLEVNSNPGKGPGHYYKNNDYAPEYRFIFDYTEYLCNITSNKHNS
ncbi:YheC/YheD family protein [Natranaerobius trueperi]|uniref:ATP-grasp domain-containing protein n=1 Tax=Natranaerobius trueperi TaxID=759412 RepID=A0A226BWT7_9FIRM|nr:YheC/YheD family protein [Natranaerobius trueperi]OWZ82774.1 hypothetical protein CDO51_12215 [Natranaerobius trueperi]